MLESHSSQKQEVSVDCDSPLLLLGGHSSQKQEVLVESDSPLLSLLSGGEMSEPERAYWTLQDGLLLFKNKLYVPPGLLRREIVRLNHDDPLAGHCGFACTLTLIQQKYNWLGMSRDIKSYVDTCDICHRIKPVRQKPYRALNSLPAPWGSFTDLTMNFSTDIPRSDFHWVV